MKSPKQPDPNQTAARILRETTAKHEQPLPADVEAAWQQWIAGIQKVDERAKTLLRAAFEAGAEAIAMLRDKWRIRESFYFDADTFCPAVNSNLLPIVIWLRYFHSASCIKSFLAVP